MTPYLQRLLTTPEPIQDAIERILAQFQAVPVGSGYVDLILPCRDAVACIERLAELPVAVHFLTWWCHCTPESTSRLGCPHGMGGPINPWGDGWFSECIGYPDVDVTDFGLILDQADLSPQNLARSCANIVSTYLTKQFPEASFFSPCLAPGLWLYVPDHWRRKRYLVDA